MLLGNIFAFILIKFIHKMRIFLFLLKFLKLDAQFLTLKGTVEQDHARIFQNLMSNDCKTG